MLKTIPFEELHHLNDERRHPLRYKDMDEHGEYSTTTYECRFGSWSNAIEAAGLSSS